MADLKNLKNTILIEEQEYNINAVRSETADKVAHSLTFNGGTKFDGSAEVEINYVPSSGGKFTGEVLIDNGYEANIPKQAIINYEQINAHVRDLTGAPLYTWGSNFELSQITTSAGNFHKLNTIVGTTQSFEIFKRLLGTPDPTSIEKSTAYYGIKLGARDENCAVDGYVDCGYTNVIIPYVGYISYTEGKSDYNGIVRTESKPVISITNKAFDVSSATTTTAKEGLKKIESVLIPASVTAIGMYAFRGCVGLNSIVIPKSVTSIGTDAFSSCTSLTTVYYDGTDEDWNKINFSSGNNTLKNATRRPYNEASNTVDFKEIIKKPLLYICTDALDSSTTYANKMFLKLPDDFSFIELSKGATRLDSTDNTATTQNYYTYEDLSNIIAQINTRLAALGNNKLMVSHPTIGEVDDVIQDPNEVPTVQELQDQLTALSGRERVYNTTNGTVSFENTTPDEIHPALRAIADAAGNNIQNSYYRSAYNTETANSITISTDGPSGGSVGDIWIVIEE